jgi:hypothetical protein
MKRCPNCNRTYANDAQKFCTKDGTSLVDASAGLAQGETVRLDSSELGTTQFDPEVTKVISRELPSQPTGDFDPYKTILAKSPDTTSDFSVSTGDLMPASMPPQPAPPYPTSSGPIAPPPPQSAPLPPPQSAPLPPPQPQSAPLPPPGSGPISAPSQPLQNSSSDVGQLTMASFAPQPLASASGPLPTAAATPPPTPVVAKKRSKLPLILGILVVLLLFGMGGLAAAYWFVVRPMLAKNAGPVSHPEPARPSPAPENTPKESDAPKTESVKVVPPYVPPSDAVQFVNSKDKLEGKLAEHYVDFSFYYPQGWQKDPTAGVPGATNFAKVQRQLAADAPQEIFAVGWYESTGSPETDQLSYPRLVQQRSSQFAKDYPEYQKVSEGATKAGPYDAYEFRFTAIYRNTDRGDIKVWGRVIFVPPVDGSKKGVTLLMLASSLASEVKGVNDVGVKGDLPMLLESFRFGK